MYTVYKYHLTITPDAQEILMPDGAEILMVADQRSTAKLWALVNTDKPMTPRTFRVFATGQEIPTGVIEGNRLDYVGSFLMQAGLLVFHVFEDSDPGQ